MGTIFLVVMWSGVWFSLAIQLVTAADKCSLHSQEMIPNTTLFLDEKEELVISIASFAVQNYLNSSAVAACNSDTVCSRGVCMPLRRDLADNALVCEAIPLNVDCGRTCTTALLSRDMAYIRLPPKARMEDPDCNMSATICAQQALDDQIFKSNKFSDYENQSQNSLTLQSYIFFGSNNGIWRIYPGKELNETACNNQDLRKRPWYLGATSVQKELVVLMDNGLGSHILSAIRGTDTFFDAAQNVTLELLETLSKGDNVSVLTFGSYSSSLVGKGTVNNTFSFNDPALDPLRTNVTIQDPVIDGPKANLTLGLLASLGQFDESLTQLKVVIMITAGDIIDEDLPESLIEELNLRYVRIFIYRFLGGSSDGNDDVTTMLKSVSCTLRGWYEEAFYSVPNPLGTIQSYYSYVARLRFNHSSQGKPYWVPQFTSTSGLGTLIAVAYPAFDGETLVGVAGADLLVDNLKLTASNLDGLLTGRNTLNPLPISDPPPIACNQTLGVKDDSLCQSVLPGGVTGFCTNDSVTNTREALVERVCCKGCCLRKPADGLSTGQLAGIIAGSSVLGIVLGVSCCCLIWQFCIQKSRPVTAVYPGIGQMRSPASESGIFDPRHSSNNSSVYRYDDVM